MKAQVLFPLFIILISCQQADNQREENANAANLPPEKPGSEEQYPLSLQQVLTAHGTLENWHKMQALDFEIVKEEGNEKHYIQLFDRRDKVEGDDFVMGFDGKEVWLQADSTYKGDPEFYHNLMFYFYAMPFVLADQGIIYSETSPLDYQNTSYPGIKISYHQGIGASSKDEYFLHYHPQTKRMAWLGYTVTYFSGEKSPKVNWIHYDDWQDVRGLLLPKSITWFEQEEGKLLGPENKVEFTNVSLSMEPHEAAFFEKPTKE